MRFDFIFFEKQRTVRAVERHRHACIDDFDLQGVYLVKINLIFSFFVFSFYFRARNKFRCWWLSG